MPARRCCAASSLFLNRDNVKQIQLAVLPDMLDEVKRKHGAHLGFSGVKIVTGGPRWVDQLAAGIDKLAPNCTHVLVHDAARPAVAYTDLEALMEAAEKHPAVALATPARSTLVEVDEGGNPLAFHAPSSFMQLQTPQAFSREKFLELAAAKREPHASELRLLKGSPLNVRIGGPGDAHFVRSMLNMLPKPKVKGASNPFEEAQW